MSAHSLKAKKLFESGYNCSQSVFVAFCDETGLDCETALKLSSSFGGGMGRLREVCGAVTGMFMVVGTMYGYTDTSDDEAKAEHYRLVQHLAEKFKKANDSIICRELLGLPDTLDSHIPEERTKAYYQSRPCSELVENAAEILDDYIQNRKQEDIK